MKLILRLLLEGEQEQEEGQASQGDTDHIPSTGEAWMEMGGLQMNL